MEMLSQYGLVVLQYILGPLIVGIAVIIAGAKVTDTLARAREVEAQTRLDQHVLEMEQARQHRESEEKQLDLIHATVNSNLAAAKAAEQNQRDENTKLLTQISELNTTIASLIDASRGGKH